MADPTKVLNFLDLFGTWDSSLASVMGVAVMVAFVSYRLVLRRDEPIIGSGFHLPTRNGIDTRMIAGLAIFGIGWGLGGFCPGPAIAALGLGATGTLALVPAMILGKWAARLLADARMQARAACSNTEAALCDVWHVICRSSPGVCPR